MRLMLVTTVLSFVTMFAISCTYGQEDCNTDVRPEIPVLMEVTQDPETLIVSARIRDESDNEQWFALERAMISQVNWSVVVGTNVPDPERSSLPLDKDTGDVIEVTDRGIVEDRRPVPGYQYAYAAQAWNCYGPSGRSNVIQLVSLPA